MTEPTTIPHGYNRYTYGCRCGVCTAAKAAYMRERRAAASERRRRAEANGQGRHLASNIRHGYAGYQDYACRCPVCCRAKKVRDGARSRQVAADG